MSNNPNGGNKNNGKGKNLTADGSAMRTNPFAKGAEAPKGKGRNQRRNHVRREQRAEASCKESPSPTASPTSSACATEEKKND